MIIRVNEKRLRQHIEELGIIGSENNKGITRISFSPEYESGRNYVAAKMAEAGLIVKVDPIGNLIGTLEGRYKHSIVMCSHIDTVPQAGMFDGCLGVLGAVEVLKTINEHNIQLNHTVHVIAFIDEERSLIGSRSFTGFADIDSICKNRLVLEKVNSEDIKKSKGEIETIDYSLELHIEQGGILDKNKINIGIVKAIVGMHTYKFSMCGVSNHAGTTPMDMRDDAIIKTAKFIDRMNELVLKFEGMVGTVGSIKALPGASNIIPGEVIFTLDIRSVNNIAIESVCSTLIKEFTPLGLKYELLLEQPPVFMNNELIAAIKQSCSALGLTGLQMNSGAGHDSMIMASITKTGMIFVPSIDGISHSPNENTEWKDVGNGADVLLNTLLNID